MNVTGYRNVILDVDKQKHKSQLMKNESLVCLHDKDT